MKFRGVEFQKSQDSLTLSFGILTSPKISAYAEQNYGIFNFVGTYSN